MKKQTLKGVEARDALLKGVEKLTDFVSNTMGPKGRNVLFGTPWNPTITNDGVTIAKQCYWPDEFENMGATIVKEAASKTNGQAGDGTSASTVLAYQLMKEGAGYVNKKSINPVILKRGMDRAVKIVTEELDRMKKDIKTREEMADIATISCQDRVTGEMIAEVFERVGKDGVVQVEENKTVGMTIEMVDGLKFDNGFLSPYMITDPNRMESVLEDVDILLTDYKITTYKQIIPLMEKMNKAGRNRLVIIAEEIEGDALATIILNRMQGKFHTLAVKAPGFGNVRKNMLQDLAILTGATLVTKETGMRLEDNSDTTILGKAKRVVASKDSTTIVNGGGDPEKLKERIEILKKEYENPETTQYEKDKVQERLAKLTGGVALLRVGAMTDVELKDKKLRIEDALSATRSAIEEGIVIGGGCALLQAANAIDLSQFRDAELIGASIVKKALSAPFTSIARNAGVEDITDLIQKLKKMWHEEGKYNQGFDADKDITDQSACLVDMFESGIIDPKKVCRCALENATSVAAMFLTTEGVIVDLPEEENKPQLM